MYAKFPYIRRSEIIKQGNKSYGVNATSFPITTFSQSSHQ